MEVFFSFLSALFSQPEYFLPTIWVALGCTVGWFLLSAKKHQAITTEEAEILWKTHKQFKNCSAETFTPITKRKKIIGYVCECGYKHKQERPIINIRN